MGMVIRIFLCIKITNFFFFFILQDTNAKTAGEWLSDFFDNTLNDPYVMDNVLILLTFDEVERERCILVYVKVY